MTILQAVMQKFTRKKIDHQIHQPEQADIQEPRLDDLVERYADLMELQANRQIIEVIPRSQQTKARAVYLDTANLEVSETSRQSMVLEINFKRGYLLLDELFPEPGNLQVGDHLTIKHHNNGKLLTFSSRLLNISSGESGQCYALALPHQVGYRQRRLYPRITLNQQQPLAVRLQSPWKTLWSATAHNLSAGGIRVSVGGNVLQQLNRGSLLRSCEFQFEGGLHIHCKARVRAFRFTRRPYRHTQISLEFVDLGSQQRLQLLQFINALGADNPLAA